MTLADIPRGGEGGGGGVIFQYTPNITNFTSGTDLSAQNNN